MTDTPPDSAAPLRLAIVGHTNTGKTSLLRTLTRDRHFGTVADQPGTTRHVEGTRLLVDGAAVLELFDTPGLEDGIGLRDYLERLPRPAQGRLDGPGRIARFLDTPEASGRFEQEARVLRKLLDCDAALYVIDARDPVLGKHRDELAVLADCGRPVLPVLNFVNSDAQRTPAWRAALARLGLHAQVEFDTVAPAIDGERQLYGRLGMLLDRHDATLQRLAASLDAQHRARREAAMKLVAELLIDAAALKLESAADDAAMQQSATVLQERVRAREQACVLALLALYNFGRDDYLAADLPLTGKRWGMDLFNPEALRDMGIQVGKGAAAGAMAGAAVDLMAAGLSLGTGMLVGAAAGGLWQGAERWGKRVVGRLRGRQQISVGDDVLRLLAVRQCLLADSLERRGHAAREPVALHATGSDTLRRGPLPPELRDARGRPDWSACGDGFRPDSAREQAIGRLAQALRDERTSARKA